MLVATKASALYVFDSQQHAVLRKFDVTPILSQLGNILFTFNIIHSEPCTLEQGLLDRHMELVCCVTLFHYVTICFVYFTTPDIVRACGAPISLCPKGVKLVGN